MVLAAATFLVYGPSLKSDFVYDARQEILEEGFITSWSNLPAVVSLQVLETNLMLGDRPGTLLYLMLIAAICGQEPFGYHLGSNLLHAANVVLLFGLLLRLIKPELAGQTRSTVLKVQLAAAAAALLFALHPIAAEPVAAVCYSSDLLVTFFTLLALLSVTAFRPNNLPIALGTGGVCTLCAFAAVTCKESGAAVAPLLVAYWFLFRRGEAKIPWLLLFIAATSVTGIFLTARFFYATSSGQVASSYFGGSFLRVFLIQPRIWVFMLGELAWPTRLSADYTPDRLSGISTLLALIILTGVGWFQVWLWRRSRLGALGIAIYWLGLATVSNFIPLVRPMADRFYYLPLAGVAMQLLALLVMASRSRWGLGACLPLIGLFLPLTFLTLKREAVFTNEFSLWSDTIQASPRSSTAYTGLGNVLFEKGQLDEAMAAYEKAVEINPNQAKAHYYLGMVFAKKERWDEAIAQFQWTLQIKPDYTEAHDMLISVEAVKSQAKTLK